MTECAWPNCLCADTGPCFITGDDPRHDAGPSEGVAVIQAAGAVVAAADELLGAVERAREAAQSARCGELQRLGDA